MQIWCARLAERPSEAGCDAGSSRPPRGLGLPAPRRAWNRVLAAGRASVGPRLEPAAPLQTSAPRAAWRLRRGLAASGGQTRETSAWKLEERRALGLTRVSMETWVLHVAPLLPPHGCWDWELQPRTPCRCQRRHFRRSSACT